MFLGFEQYLKGHQPSFCGWLVLGCVGIQIFLRRGGVIFNRAATAVVILIAC